MNYNAKKYWRHTVATVEKMHIIQAQTPEELESHYNQWAMKHLKKVGIEVIDRQYLQTENGGFQVAIFYKEVVL